MTPKFLTILMKGCNSFVREASFTLCSLYDVNELLFPPFYDEGGNSICAWRYHQTLIHNP